MNLSVRPYEAADAEAWDSFCACCLQATFLHSRRFLSYHGNRFEDASLIVEDDGQCAGLFPAALNPENSLEVISHPGLTYGGVLHQGALRGGHMMRAMQLIAQYYAERGHRQVLYKAVPTIYHQVPSQDDLYALFRLNARRVRCDLSSAIDLSNRQPVASRRVRGLKKSLKAGIEVVSGIEHIASLWRVLEENLRVKFNATPVHSAGEISLLADLFPEKIRCVCGVLGGSVVAGVILFATSSAVHAQYIASSEVGYATSALDMVFDFCIDSSANHGAKWFDFGTSNERSGRYLNDGLYEFKSNFGGGGVAHEFYELDLRGASQ